MAEKFLDQFDLEEFVEGMKMTRIGEMLLKDGIEQGMAQGIESTVQICKEFGISKEDTIFKISKAFEYDEEEAQSAVEKYWK